MRVPRKAKGFGFPGATITGTCEPLEVGAGDHFIPLQELKCSLTAESSLQFSDPNSFSSLKPLRAKGSNHNKLLSKTRLPPRPRPNCKQGIADPAHRDGI